MSLTKVPGIRSFNSLDEVLENLDTLTIEECKDIHERLGIIVEIQNGAIVDARYDMDPMEAANDSQLLACG